MSARLIDMVGLLTGIANRGDPMVENQQIADALKCARKTVPWLLTEARRAGILEVIYSPNGKRRRVKVIATGALSDWQSDQRYWGHSKTRQTPAPKLEPVTKVRMPGRYSGSRALAGGYSDLLLYGHLCDAVRFCRSRGDVVHRDERDKTQILINGRAGDPKARQAWHQRYAMARAGAL